jgi:hypothetical protein
MYIRFVCSRIDEDSHCRLGVFQAAFQLLGSDAVVEAEDRAAMRRTLDWFNENLVKPERLSRSRKPNAASNAISWYRQSAHGHIQRMHGLCTLLDKYGVATHIIRCDRPGVIVYSDDHQIAAVPFRDTPI